MTLQALNDRVIVRLDEAPNRQGTIVVPDTARDAIAAKTGVVVSVGPSANEHNAGLIQPGLRVHFNRYSGLNVDPSDDTLLAIAASELLAIEEDSNPMPELNRNLADALAPATTK